MHASRIRARVQQVLDASSPHDTLGRVVDIALISLISLNVLAIVLESEAGFHGRFEPLLHAFELFSVAIFTVEYGLRVWSCVDDPGRESSSPAKARFNYFFTPLALIDLIAIVPFYLAFFFQVDLRFLRVVRLLRVFKLTRYSAAMKVLLSVLREEASSLVAAFFILFVLLIVASSGIYLIEHAVQPEAFGSIPSSMWWAMATLTTVGYGDVTPITPGGRFFGGCITLVGMGMVALPAGILASAFSDQLHRRRELFSAKLDNVLEDGIVTEQEKRELDQLQEDLGLSEQEAARLKMVFLTMPVRTVCPHCGKAVNAAATKSQ